jgi:hypothetical protein
MKSAKNASPPKAFEYDEASIAEGVALGGYICCSLVCLMKWSSGSCNLGRVDICVLLGSCQRSVAVETFSQAATEN